jgi:hypothetical protein
VIVVVQLLLVVALATLVKLASRRLFRGREGTDQQSAADGKRQPEADGAPRAKPKPTSRTNGPGQRRR